MVRCVVLLPFLILLTINGRHSMPQFRSQSLGALTKLLRKDAKQPMIVVVDTVKDERNLDNEMVQYTDSGDESVRDDDLFDENEDSDSYSDDKMDSKVRQNYQSVLYDMLRTFQAPDNPEKQEAEEILIANALRSRCEIKRRCEDQCNKLMTQKYCKDRCQSKYDNYIECPEKKKKTQCPATGKTLPPTWRF